MEGMGKKLDLIPPVVWDTMNVLESAWNGAINGASTWERFPAEMKNDSEFKAQGRKNPCGFINEVISLNESLGRQAQVGEAWAGPAEERCPFKAFSCPSLPACPEDSQHLLQVLV